MAEPRNLHRATTRLLSSLMVVLGVAMIASTLVNGGGGLALGLLLGVLFIAAGLGRLYLSARTDRAQGS
jgi:hypothetical protein